jgi:predicted deacylase
MTRPDHRRHVWGEAPDGTPLTFPLIRFEGGPGPHALFTGGIHGDEFEGPLALLDLARTLETLPVKGTITIIPVANTQALSSATRLSPLDSVNLARSFPGDRHGGPTARLAASLFAFLDDVDLLFDCHAGGVELCFLPVAGFYAEGAGITAATAAASRSLATATGLPDLWELPPTGGVLSNEAARRGIPVTGCEIGGRGYARPSDVALYHDAFLRTLAHAGILGSAARPSSPQPRILSGNWSLAPSSGLFRPLVALGAAVKAGETIARIEAVDGQTAVPLVAERDGIVMAERNLCRVRSGDLAILVAEVAR